MAATRPKHSMLDPSNGGTAVDSAAAGPSGGLASAVPRRSEGWRADIDGLRAVGVLAVIVFHLRKRWLPGGFAGVDVFFVISGFLITRAIVEDLSAGVFSRTEFYRRRVKRISLPMLAVVLATVAFAQVALLPKDALATAWSGVAAVLSGANVYFWRALDRSYFAPGTDEVPLLHLWSLGVEEQFYLLWPWVVPWILGRRGTANGGASGLAAHVEDESPRRDAATASLPAGRMALMAAVALASFLLGDALFGSAPYFAYYMLPTRVGELLVGAILAFAVAGGALQAPGSLLREAAGAAGAALVLGSLVLLSESKPFPGWRALAPTVGAALLLLSGQGMPSAVSRVLSLRPLVAVGRVSYSAYLWHWPLIAFWKYGFRQVGDLAGLGIFAATFALAAASHRWIERPARRTTASAERVAVLQWFVPGGVVMAAALLAIATRGLGPRALSASYAGRLDAMLRVLRPAYGYESVCQYHRVESERLFEPVRCVNGAEGGPDGVLLWGDSNAAHYVGMLDVIARAAGFRFRNFEVTSCPPVLEAPGRLARKPLQKALCEAASRLVKSRIGRYPVVVLAGRWDGYTQDGLFDALAGTARGLVAEGHRVILVGEIPRLPEFYDPDCGRRALSFPGLDCPAQVTAPIAPEVRALNARLAEIAERTPGVEYFDANRELCPEGRCSAFAADGTVIYRDSTHLTMPGSILLGQAVLSARGVPPPFDQVPAWLAEAGRGAASPPRDRDPS